GSVRVWPLLWTWIVASLGMMPIASGGSGVRDLEEGPLNHRDTETQRRPGKRERIREMRAGRADSPSASFPLPIHLCVSVSLWFHSPVCGHAHSGEGSSSWGTGGLSRSTLPVGQPGPEGFFSQPRMGRTMFSAEIGVPL